MVPLRIVVFLEKFETSSGELNKKHVSLGNVHAFAYTYPVSTMIPWIGFVTGSYTTWHVTFFLVSIIEIVMDEVIIHLDK